MPPQKRRGGQPPPDASSDASASSSPLAFTPERFERELVELAAKARADTTAAAVRRAAPHYARALLFVLFAAASSAASVAALSPVYGAIPAARLHAPLVFAAWFVGWAANHHARRLLPARWPLPLWLPVLAAALPALQALLTQGAAARLLHRLVLPGGFGGAGATAGAWAPLATEALTLLPLVAACVACAADALDAADAAGHAAAVVPGSLRGLADAVPGLGTHAVLRLGERAATALFAAATAAGADASAVAGHRLATLTYTALGTRVARQLVLAAAAAAALPSRLLWCAVPAALHAALLNPHVAGSPWALAAANRALRPADWVLLARRESLTGYVAVAENRALQYRVLRCDHSLLGGEWLAFAADPVAEPIYGVFAMLEAVRLVEGAEGVAAEGGAAEGGAAEGAGGAAEEANPPTALVIGLGVGTAPAALVAHGIATTVVEIDPAVHALAAQFFHPPAPGRLYTPVVADAVAYTEALVAAPPADRPRFDYIVHDVFTGGAEPIALFTLEFLQTLHALLAPTGAVAINFAGDLARPPVKAVVHTVRAVFPRCRVFRDTPRPEAINDDTVDFANLVIFCTKHAGGGAPLAFRAPRPADLLGSGMRQRFLLPQHEVRDSDFRAPEAVRVVRRNDTEQLARHHTAGALGHWALMRNVLPATVWEQW